MTDADFFFGVTDSEVVDVGTFGLHEEPDYDEDNSLDALDAHEDEYYAVLAEITPEPVDPADEDF
jgi:hypothetical protein